MHDIKRRFVTFHLSFSLKKFLSSKINCTSNFGESGYFEYECGNSSHASAFPHQSHLLPLISLLNISIGCKGRWIYLVKLDQLIYQCD